METVKIMWSFISSKIPLRLKLYVLYRYYHIKKTSITISNRNRIWIFLAADYGNLGDVAITYAQHKFLEEQHPNYDIIEVPISKTLQLLPSIKKQINLTDIITIVGGGNISDIYDDIEYLRQLIIKAFPNNTIISFPQSIYFSNTKYGKQRFKIAQNVYSNHKNLTLMARDKNTYKIMTINFNRNKVVLNPDIALLLNWESNFNRKGVLLCLRNDKEKAITDEVLTEILGLLQSRYDNIECFDTQIDNQIISQIGNFVALKNVLNKFSKSELVITDRLHGMIFAFITKTPAIIIDNRTQKISACYDWIKDCNYIHFLNPDKFLPTLTTDKNFDKIHKRINRLFRY